MGNAESQPIRNVDKRTARRDNALQYNQAIWNYRAHVLGPLKPPELLPAELGPAHSDNGSASVRVCIRRRPIFPHEMKAGEFDVVSCDGRAIVVHDCRLRPDCRNLIINHTTFRFDRVFDESATSDMVYDAEVAPLVRQAASTTVPGTVLMYGQTGSGKTFTMTALQSRVAADLFSTLDASGSDVVSASYVEVGSSGVRDLLNGGATCQLLTDASGEVQPVPLVEVRVEGADGLKSLFDFGKGVRATAATGVHDASSRSHAIFRLNVQRAGASPGEVGSLTLVDLAGSEQRIDSDKHDAKRAKEGAAINASLLALKDSIVTLASGGKFRSVAGGRHPLTQLLRHSFEGEARTTVLVTVSPSSKDTEHSINTLRHACVMHGQKTDGAQPGVVGRDEGHVGAVYIRGGDVQTEHIGEIDVVAARKRLLQEEARRDATSGHGVFRQVCIPRASEALVGETSGNCSVATGTYSRTDLLRCRYATLRSPPLTCYGIIGVRRAVSGRCAKTGARGGGRVPPFAKEGHDTTRVLVLTAGEGACRRQGSSEARVGPECLPACATLPSHPREATDRVSCSSVDAT